MSIAAADYMSDLDFDNFGVKENEIGDLSSTPLLTKFLVIQQMSSPTSTLNKLKLNG